MTIRPARDLVAQANAMVETIPIEQARRLWDEGEVQFVDVRETVEWQQARVPGAAHVPRGSLEFLADPSVPGHRAELHEGRKLVLYCAAGGRSALAARTLKDMGFRDVCHVAGGFGAWQQAGFPVEP
ncbi:rhodanese-like domain-containing protein [Geminicoccaceae bacterium 1502E]|nr:rhodanese-like domain-containing protein [Geminicoccaceae bacterium 1502E]